MITPQPLAVETENWQRELAEAISDPLQLLDLLHIERETLRLAVDDMAGFPLRVPRYFVDLMRRGDINDPLLRQVLPLRDEGNPVTGYTPDPVGDMAASLDHGVLQKYHGRALLVTTGACAVHCRYCFRRHYPYSDQSSVRQSTQAVATLRRLHDVEEVILSGGDPLTLSDQRLAGLLREFEGISHLRRLRLHTRVPVVLPSRVTNSLVEVLSAQRLQTVVVLHINHPNEITPFLGESLSRLAAARILLLNQSVLLKSINDDADTLAMLSERLLEIGVMPYYLHALDPVAGAAHFDVAAEQAVELLRELRKRLPGYLVPKLVRETPGEPSKLPLDTR